jgi:hypothetical protein
MLCYQYLRITSFVFQQRKRAVTIHVSDGQGERLQGAAISINQISKDFPFGSAIAKTILGNLPYQVSLLRSHVLKTYANLVIPVCCCRTGLSSDSMQQSLRMNSSGMQQNPNKERLTTP